MGVLWVSGNYGNCGNRCLSLGSLLGERPNGAHAAKSAALQDAQGLADVLLDAEAKLGAMLAGIERTVPEPE